MYTVVRIDGKLHQPHRMAPDQTIRVMEKKFDICDVHIWFFPTFPMEIFDRFEVFRLYSLFKGWKFPMFRSFPILFHCKGWKSPTFRRFPIIFLFQRMEIPDVLKFSDNIPSSKDGNSRCLRQEILRAIGFLIKFYNANTRYV